MTMRRLGALAVLLLAGCPSPEVPAPQKPRPPQPTPAAPVTPTKPTEPVPPEAVTPPQITWKRIEHASDVPSTPPPAGTYRIHLIDVGTGLAILVQGSD